MAIALVALMAFVVQTAFGAQAAALSTLNFPDVEIEGAARAMSAILDRQIVLDPRVKGKMTLYTEQAVTPAQAYAIFAANLRGLGFALVESGGLLMVVPETEAKLQAEAATRNARAGDRVMTQVFRLVHENAANLVPVLRPLITANNTINVNAGNNSLVITDYANNLVRLGALIAALDTPSATDTEVMPLQYALAADLAVTVQRLTEGAVASAVPANAAQGAAPAAAGAGQVPSIIADSRINALLVRAANPARLASIRALVAQLDRPGSSGAGGSNIHVIYLQNVEATRLATVLRAALPADKERTGAGNTTSAGIGGTVASSSGAATGSSSSSTASGVSSLASTTPIASTAQPSIGGYIQADPATNSLVVTAPEPLFREVRAVVDLLDSQRAQLYVESLVVEVDASKALDIGLQWKQIFNIGNTTELTLGTVATALESMSGTNILSTANVVTLDNEEAKIVVGQNVPFVTGSYTTTSTSSPFQTIERKDVGVTLRIRPQIGRNGAIRMTIQQESSSVASTSATSGPTTNKRSIESTVVVNDGKIIVLGGLIEDSYTTSADQIPLLADLPYLGGVFRTLSRTRKKTNLVVFLRPVVMHDADDTQRLSLDRYDYIHARQRELPTDERGILKDAAMPALPVLAK